MASYANCFFGLFRHATGDEGNDIGRDVWDRHSSDARKARGFGGEKYLFLLGMAEDMPEHYLVRPGFTPEEVQARIRDVMPWLGELQRSSIVRRSLLGGISYLLKRENTKLRRSFREDFRSTVYLFTVVLGGALVVDVAWRSLLLAALWFLVTAGFAAFLDISAAHLAIVPRPKGIANRLWKRIDFSERWIHSYATGELVRN